MADRRTEQSSPPDEPRGPGEWWRELIAVADGAGEEADVTDVADLPDDPEPTSG